MFWANHSKIIFQTKGNHRASVRVCRGQLKISRNPNKQALKFAHQRQRMLQRQQFVFPSHIFPQFSHRGRLTQSFVILTLNAESMSEQREVRNRAKNACFSAFSQIFINIDEERRILKRTRCFFSNSQILTRRRIFFEALIKVFPMLER